MNNDRDKFFHLMKFLVLNDPYLFKYYSDKVFRRYVLDDEVRNVLYFCYDQACGGGILVVGRLQPEFFNVVSIG